MLAFQKGFSPQSDDEIYRSAFFYFIDYGNQNNYRDILFVVTTKKLFAYIIL